MEELEYIRKPFTVTAILITRENIAELAPRIGTLRTRDDGVPWIEVDPAKIPKVPRVYPGFYLTNMGGNDRVYSSKIFHEQFVQTDDSARAWMEYLNSREDSNESESEGAHV